MTELPRRPAILDIVEEHFNEFEFLWELRERYLFSPEWTVRNLNETKGASRRSSTGFGLGLGIRSTSRCPLWSPTTLDSRRRRRS